MKLPAPKLKWKKGDIDAHRVFDNWTLAPPSFDEPIVPHEIFESSSRLKRWKEYVCNQTSMLDTKAITRL